VLEHIIGAAVEVAANDTDRELSVARPSRSVSAVRDASTVPPGWEAFAECVEQRESGGNPSILNHEGSGAAGLFQLMPPWRHGGPYNVRERLLQYGATKKQAKAVRATRDAKLAATDWVVIKAVETGTAVPAETAATRQALRDITSQAGFPWTITWPDAV